MEKYEAFKAAAAHAAHQFHLIDKNETIRLISHLDSDGIAACSLMVKALNIENRKYSISIVQQLGKEVLQQLAKEEYTYFVFTDLGSGQIDIIHEYLRGRKIFIFDHHQLQSQHVYEGTVQVNPLLYGIDGSKEISGAGVVYYVVRNINKKLEHYAHVALIGAVGDVQEEEGNFHYLNNEILEMAKQEGTISVSKGLRFFGQQTKPLYKLLEYSTEVYIPGVTGSESGAIQFLQDIGIHPKSGREWKKISELTKGEMERLVAHIILKRKGEPFPEDILGLKYTLTFEEEDSPTRDLREFSTLLNACGRLNKASLGIGACLNDAKIKKRAFQALTEYRREIMQALLWYYDPKNNPQIIREDGFIIINAKDQVLGTIIGTLASIISKSKDVRENQLILSMAQLFDNTTKISLRIAGHHPRQDIDLKGMVIAMVQGLEGCEAGGHQFAAGAVIPSAMEPIFIERAKTILRQKSIEEKVL